jgi:L-fucose isomerase-like protein
MSLGTKLMNKKPVLAVIVGNRGIFPDELIKEGRAAVLKKLEELGIEAVVLSESQTDFGSVETREDAKKCARLFEEHRKEIDGVLITLPNFGDEKAIAESVRMSGLEVPILIHAFPDKKDQLDLDRRADAFCGKLSAANNLYQYGFRYTNTTLHVESPDSKEFENDIKRFVRICLVVQGLRHARVGAFGARVSAFNTVRFSEKLMERSGIAVETIDLSEIIGRADGMKNDSNEVIRRFDEIKEYVPTAGVPDAAVNKIARLSLVMKEWIEEEDLDAVAVQCWSALEEYYGVAPCTAMSMLSQSGIPAACEVDIMGALSMYALQLASGSPAALLDWNNNYGDDPDRCVMFHCSNLPACFFAESKMRYLDLLARTVDKGCTFGSIDGCIAPGPATLLRLSTNDTSGAVRGYVAEGEFEDEKLESFGGRGVMHVHDLQALLDYMVENGFEHHIALTQAHTADILKEAVGKYMGWNIYRHK